MPLPVLPAILLGLMALGTPPTAAQMEFPYAAGTDSSGRAQAVSDAAGRVMIESPEFPRGLWVDMVDEAGHALPGIQVEYEGPPDSLVAIWSVDPSGLRQATLLWTRPGGDPIRLELKSGKPANLPLGLASIDWQIDPSVEALLESSRMVGWTAVEALLRERVQDQAGRVVLKLDDVGVIVDLEHPEAIETLVTYLQKAYQPVTAGLADSPIFSVSVYDGSHSLLREGTILHTSLFEDEAVENAIRRTFDRPQGRIALEEVTAIYRLPGNLLVSQGIRSVAGLEHFTALSELQLSGNQIIDVSPLASLTKLHFLQLALNQVADVSPLAFLTKLEYLGLQDNRVVDVNPLASLPSLEWLELGGNEILDVSPLASLTSLERLHLESNQIADVSPLAPLINLGLLTLRHNEIVDVRPLAPLSNLSKLYLAHNQIVDLSPLATLTSLEFLDLEDNEIVDLSPLAHLPNLEILWLDNNQIQDLGPLVASTDQELSVLSLEGNPLSDQAINEQIPALRARGVGVSY